MTITNGDQTIIELKSSRFGDLTISSDSLISFPNGIIGFPKFKKYVLLDYKEPFSWLHSIEDPNLAFVVIDSASLEYEYKSKDFHSEKDCDFQENDQCVILAIVTVKSNPAETTVNLKAPIVINLRTRKAVQVILEDSRLTVRHKLMSA